jgi:hypothetical protein
LSRFWLIVSIPAAILATWLLVKTVLSLLHMVRQSVVATVPIKAEQQIDFPGAGNFTLSWEAPLHARRGVSLTKQLPMGLGYILSRVNPPYVVPLFYSRSQIHVDSMTRSRSQIINFEVPSSGPYMLRMSNVDPSVDYSNFAVVVSRPIGFKLVLRILGILILSFASIGAIVVTGQLISGKGHTTSGTF